MKKSQLGVDKTQSTGYNTHMKNNNAEQPEFVGFNFMGDIIEHFKDAEKAYQSALMNGFSVKQAEEIRIEVEKN